MVLNNVTKFHKILIKTIQVKRADVLRCGVRTDICTYIQVRMNGQTGVTLNSPTVVKVGA